MKVKKMAALILSMILAAGTLTACGSDGGEDVKENTASAPEEKEAVAEGDDGTVYQVTLAMPVNGPVDEKNDTLDYLNTLVPGLEIKVEGIEIGSYWDILNPRLASGEIPDIIHCHNDSMYTSYLSQGVLGGVSPELLKEYMPKYVKATEEYGIELWSLVLKDGMVYGLPIMSEAQTHPFTNAWRGDWLKAVGIDKVPETVDEYEEALTRFTFDDPDGNGVDDTYGTTLRGKDSTPYLFSSLFGAYGVFPSMWNLAEDGTLQYGIIDPRAKEALLKLNSWFKKGIIDPEFAGVDGSIRTEKWINSQIGMLSDSTYYEVNEGNSPCDNLKALTPEAEILRGPAPKGPNGDYGYINWSKYTNRIIFGKTLTEDEGKLKKVLQLLELMDTDPEVYNRLYYGKEGENWKRNEENMIVKIPPYSDPANCGALGTNIFKDGGIAPVPSVKAQTVSEKEPEQYKYAEEGTMVNGENYFGYLSKFISDDINTAYNAEADTLYKKNFIDFITGARSLDEYDAFVEEWLAAGGEAYTQAYNDCYKNVESIMAEAANIFK